MTDSKIKVTDKRMFTPEGELREEFRHLEKGGSQDPEPGPDSSSPDRPPEDRPRVERSRAGDEAAGDPRQRVVGQSAADSRSARVELPPTEPGLASPTFFDLVSMLAQPVPLYLGDATLPDGESAENLDLARIHIDLLDVLRQKTSGNLSSHELTFLEDLLYQLRLRYLKKRG